MPEPLPPAAVPRRVDHERHGVRELDRWIRLSPVHPADVGVVGPRDKAAPRRVIDGDGGIGLRVAGNVERVDVRRSEVAEAVRRGIDRGLDQTRLDSRRERPMDGRPPSRHRHRVEDSAVAKAETAVSVKVASRDAAKDARRHESKAGARLFMCAGRTLSRACEGGLTALVGRAPQVGDVALRVGARRRRAWASRRIPWRVR